MVVNHPDGTPMDNYYNGNRGTTNTCPNNADTVWWGVTPYNRQETFYWFIKMIALPLVPAVIFIIIFRVGLGDFNDPIIQWISNILLFVGNIFLTSHIRETVRASIYSIDPIDGLIDEGNDPSGIVVPSTNHFTVHLNSLSQVQYEIGFLGDIMMLKGHALIFHPDVIAFFNGVNIIVGNLEGIVRQNGSTFLKQAHIPAILDQLNLLLSGTRQWLLCLSNNHSIDYGNREFQDSLDNVQAYASTFAYGRHDVTHVITQNHSINIATATQWSNQPNMGCISQYINANINIGFPALHLNDHFNILYPHWGYENERYVRPSIQGHANAILTNQNNQWDLIFGHHPHTRQPIMRVRCNTATGVPFYKLVVFSGGNFTSGAHILRRRKHIFGTIMRCQIGPLAADNSQLAIGDVSWQRTVNVRTTPSTGRTKTIEVDRGDYPNSNTTSLIIAIIIIASIFLVRFLEMFFS